MPITYETLLKEDMELGYGTADRTNPQGGTMTGNKIGIHTFLNNTFNARDFGATGDGSTDDTTAINAAITQAATAGGTVYLPEGTYRISSSLTLSNTNGVRLVGTNRKESIIESYCASGDYAIDLTGTTTADLYPGGGLENLQINIRTSGGNGIKMYECRSMVLRNIGINGQTQTGAIGLFMDGGNIGNTHNTLEAMYIAAMSDTGVKMDTTVNANAFCNRNFLRSIHVNNCTNYGFYIDGASTNYVETSVQNCGVGLYFAAGTDANYFWITEETNTVGVQFVNNSGPARNMIFGSIDEDLITNQGALTTFITQKFSRFLQVIWGGFTFRNDSATHTIQTSANSTDDISIKVCDNGGTRQVAAQTVQGVAAPYMTFPGGVKLGGGTLIAKHIANTKVWDPASLDDGQSATTTITGLTGVDTDGNSVCVASLTTLTNAAWQICAFPSGSGQATVVVTNHTGGTVDIASGTLRVDAWING